MGTRLPRYWTYGSIGALAGVAWAAALRSYMWQISEAPTVDWTGTFAAIVLPGAVCGALLGVAEVRRDTGLGRGLGWFALAPFVFPVAALAMPGVLWTFLTTGLGGGSVGVALLAIAGGAAVSWRGPVWARVLFGVIAVALLGGLTAAVPLLGGDDLALTTPRGA